MMLVRFVARQRSMMRRDEDFHFSYWRSIPDSDGRGDLVMRPWGAGGAARPARYRLARTPFQV
jgi:hypothetical protein